MANTPLRNIRIEDDLWNAAREVADEKDTTVTEVIRNALQAFVKTGGAALVGIIAVLLLAGCGGAETPGTTPVVQEQGDVVETSAPVVTETVTTEPVETAVAGEDVETGEGTMKITPLDTGWYAVEVYTDELVIFDGTYTGTDAAGVEHVGTPMLDALRANGYAGNQVRFGAPGIVTITYTGEGIDPITWTVG